MKEYRQNVAAIILNKENKIWLAKRADGMNWGFPQGGIEAGENPESAIIRELSEEIGTKNFEIIGQYPGTLKYDFPKDMKFPTWTYAGQEQHYFLVRLDEQEKIDLESHPEEIEFSSYQFLSLTEILKIDFGFKS
ncbi:RNA pyrophosphohydrolase [Lactococcus cremoris]|uniref:NUDIX family hydrolase n=1 Tax=Lactococcus lactis subsp. cremoris TaxID=1359 RepID=A0A896T8A6_LACLC|nr:RNA pyrophosphohydrolase [Lactococcus cremoris]MCT4399619.1 RNA pyrophosphohydrolase [Lactococcus cremoris]MCT4429243.1 RNA pyrophosphohydrolase [Lactococcus cremoris]QSD62269.1 RNA pyrophosphohydrolase [Lactococcus cremoris]UXV63960.1 RNA pyrophosphohydrolase [Lactococcus cremoris]